MTVAHLENTMTNAEYIGWSMFYQLRAAEADVAEQMSQTGRR